MPRTPREPEIGYRTGVAGESVPLPLLRSLGAPTAQPRAGRRQYRPSGTKLITLPQAYNIMDAVQFAKSIALPLVAHLTIYWAVTEAGDDPLGQRFARVREGLSKWLRRHGIEFAGAWARECPGGNAEHCHMLFHLPMAYRSGQKLHEIDAEIYGLVERHGHGVWGDGAVRLVIWPNPDGKYLIKGGGPTVWKRFRLRPEHRCLQGTIHGKRCGTTQNIGPAVRARGMVQAEVA